MSKENQEYYNLYYKNKSKGLSSNEKKRMNDLSYQKEWRFVSSLLSDMD